MHIFHKDINELRQIVARYPYFSIAQLALAKKLKAEDSDSTDLPAVLQKAGVYFSNHLWLNYLLNADDVFTEKRMQVEEENTTEETVATDRIAHMLSQQAAGFQKPVTGQEKLFDEPEPLFKTDYFKHQGIEADETEVQTQLGQKVKKFTDWLRQMKKLHPATPQFNTSESEEKAAAMQAMHSLDNSEVLTESMAEVLVLQGKKLQAIEIYEKLSLINPEKSVYFASRIKFLKEK